MSEPAIRPATADDADAIWRIFHAVVSAGDTYSFAPDTDRDGALDLMMAQPLATYVAELDGAIAGCFYIKPNQPGLGSHVCNAGFMVAPEKQRRGLGRAMGAFALEEAKRLGFTAMIFNFVVATNTGAIALWKSFGFTVIGTVPGAFNHARLVPTDIHVMLRTL